MEWPMVPPFQLQSFFEFVNFDVPCVYCVSAACVATVHFIFDVLFRNNVHWFIYVKFAWFQIVYNGSGGNEW